MPHNSHCPRLQWCLGFSKCLKSRRTRRGKLERHCGWWLYWTWQRWREMLLRCQSSRLFLENTQTGCAVIKTHRAALSTTCNEHTFNHDTKSLQVHCVAKETGQLFQTAHVFVGATPCFFLLLFAAQSFQHDGSATASFCVQKTIYFKITIVCHLYTLVATCRRFPLADKI